MKSLEGKTILITRDASQAGGLESLLTEMGARVISVPTISITDPPDWKPFDQAAKELKSFEWIVFTSVNAVHKTLSRLRLLKLTIGELPPPYIAAVGDQTARQLQEAEWPVHLIPDKYQSEDLGSELVSRGVKGNRIWIPRALKGGKKLPELLEREGAEVIITPVYQNTIPHQNREPLLRALQENDIDWVTFTSSSTAVNFLALLGDRRQEIKIPKCACIGSVTTDTLREYSLEPEVTADPQNLAGLCDGISAWEEQRLAENRRLNG